MSIPQQLLVSQTTANSSVGGSTSHQPESPLQRRRRYFDQDSGHDSSSHGNMNSPSVITPTSAIQRPCDFYKAPQIPANKCRVDELDRPPVPVRKSLLKAKSSNSENNVPASAAESVIASAMDPIVDVSGREKNPNLSSAYTETSKVQGDSMSPPGRSLAPSKDGTRGQPSEILKRVYRRRLDLDSWRRRSEPVASAVKQAVNMQRNSQGDPVTAQNDDGFRHSRSFSLREEIRQSKEKMHHLDKARVPSGPNNSDPSSDSHSVSSLSSLSLSSSLPPPAASTGLKYCGSPLLKNRGGGVPSPRPIRSLSKKSRSFSNIDAEEVKQTFKDRMSWKGKVPVLKKTADPLDLETGSKTTKGPDSESALIQSYGEKLNSGNDSAETDSSKPDTDSEVTTQPKIQEGQLTPNLMRASRENRGKPLSLSHSPLARN